MWRFVFFLAHAVALAGEKHTKYVDLNFDGNPDKMEFVSRGGGRNARNVTYEISLFDPRTRKYVVNVELSELGSPEAHPDSKTITAFWRSGPTETSRVYRWKGSNLVLVEETVCEFKEGGTLTTVKKLQDGEMEVVSETVDPAQ